MRDISHLDRFIKAQEKSYQIALKEIKNGRKLSHWMWFIFPQIDGLGMSSISRKYSIKTQQEARDYFNHHILGSRLINNKCFNENRSKIRKKYIWLSR